MSKWDKLLKKLKTCSRDVTFEELKKILNSYGYKESQANRGGSHYNFKKGDKRVTIPKHSPIGRVYIMIIKDPIDEDEQIR